MHLSILTICVIFRFLNYNMHARFAPLSAGLGGFLSTICAFIIHALQNAAQILFVTDVLVDYYLDPIGIIFREYCRLEVLLFVLLVSRCYFYCLLLYSFSYAAVLKSSAHTLCIFKILLNKYIIKWP